MVLIVVLYLFFRLFNLPETVNYSDDQGKILLSVFDIWRNKELVLIGPPTSFSYDGRYFYFGPITYYVLLPAMAIGQWNALFGSYSTIALNLISLIAIYLATRKLFGKEPAYLAAFLFAVFPETIYYTKFVWNPNFLPVMSALVLALIVGVGKFNTEIRMLLIGICFGLGLQFHYQFLLVILPVLIYILLKNKQRMIILITLLIGFIIGYMPLLLFELRNDFYNIKTILFLMENNAFVRDSQPPSYYFLSIFPFIFTFGAGSLFFLKKRYAKILWSVIVIIVVTTSILGIQTFSSNRGMPENWRYTDAQKVAEIIIDKNLPNYNIANLLSGDTRAYSLRYLVEVGGSKPLNETDYPNAENLFVLSSLNEEKTNSHSVWEVSSFKGSIKERWLIKSHPDFYLYLMTKN